MACLGLVLALDLLHQLLQSLQTLEIAGLLLQERLHLRFLVANHLSYFSSSPFRLSSTFSLLRPAVLLTDVKI